MKVTDKNRTKVSGCVVTYNNNVDAVKCVESILKYTKGVEFQLFISDNNSTDSTAINIKDKFDNVKVIFNKSNDGFGAGHNVVLNKIESKYHVIINPDIIIDKDIITELVEYMEENPEVGMITPKILNNDGSEQYLPKRRPTLKYLIGGRINIFNKYRREYTMEDKNIIEPVEIDFCTGCFMLIRTELFKMVKGFDDRYFMYFEDADLTNEIKKHSKVIFYPYGNVYHKWNRESSKKLKYLIIQIQSMVKYYRKWRKEYK